MCPTLPNEILQNLSRKIPMEKKSLTSKVSRGEQGYLLPFLSKKCIFRAEKGIFSKRSFYTKMFSNPKYNFSVHQKYFFVVQYKVSIFHRIQPMHMAYLFIFRKKDVVDITLEMKAISTLLYTLLLQ